MASHSNPHTARVVLSCLAVGLLVLGNYYARPDGGGPDGKRSIVVARLDSVKCWCSPLWGHNAAKIVEGKNGEVYAALFSGKYPEATVQIMKRSADGAWNRGSSFSGAYQPSLLFVDEGGRLNVIQNSQTGPLIHYRSSDDANLSHFERVSEGNGQQDGRGWYVGAGICHDTVYMAYILLSYDLFLTWKRVTDPVWNPPVLIHRGSVDPVTGNHSWTRPRFQFSGRHGYFVVNETSDGSVKNTYNAVQLVTFDLADPRQFSTECVDRVPVGFGAYSSDFITASDGWLYCVVEHNARIYESPATESVDPGVFVFSRSAGGGDWTSRKVFATLSDAALVASADGDVHVLRVCRSGSSSHADRLSREMTTEPARWEEAWTSDHGTTWSVPAAYPIPFELHSPSHIQITSCANSCRGSGGDYGMFEDVRGVLDGTTLSAFNVYCFSLKGNDKK